MRVYSPTYEAITKCWIRRWSFRRLGTIEVRSGSSYAIALYETHSTYWRIWFSGSGEPTDHRYSERISYWIVALYVSGIRSGVERVVDQHPADVTWTSWHSPYQSANQPTLRKMTPSGSGQLQSYLRPLWRNTNRIKLAFELQPPRFRQETICQMWKWNQLNRVTHNPMITTREIRDMKIRDGNKWQLQRLCLVVGLVLNGSECLRSRI